MRPLELLAVLATAAFIVWRIAAYQRALARRRDATTAVWTAHDPDEGGPMSTIANTLEMERGARKRLTITGLDRRRNAVDLEALILSVVGAAVVRVDEETDPAFPDSFIVTALQDGECDLELLCDARPGEGSVQLQDRRHVIVRSPDAIATKWNEVDLEDLPPVVEQPPVEQPPVTEPPVGSEAGAGEQTVSPSVIVSAGTRPASVALRAALLVLFGDREDREAIASSTRIYPVGGPAAAFDVAFGFGDRPDTDLPPTHVVTDLTAAGVSESPTPDTADAILTQAVWESMLSPHAPFIAAEWNQHVAATANAPQQ